MAYTEPEPDGPGEPLGLGGWTIIAVLIALLIGACLFGYHAWTAMDGTTVSTAGWIFMGLGVVVTTAVGAGLMFLVFYSSRKHYDR